MKCNVIRARRIDAMSLLDATATTVDASQVSMRTSMSLIDATVNITVAAADQTLTIFSFFVA